MKKRLLIYTTLAFLLTACNSPSNESKTNEAKIIEPVDSLSNAELLVQSIENSHQKNEFMKKEVVSFDMKLIFGGKTRFNGSIIMTTDGRKIKMQDSNRTIFWNDNEAKLTPEDANDKGARFDVLTWSYFFAAPFKLSDSGVKHNYIKNSPLSGGNYQATKMTFDSGVGDSPDDWYIVYKNQENDLLAAMAYIVTYSKSVQDAAEDPHVITYEAYTDIDGIPFATQWNFWTWNEDGETKKLLGEAAISNIQFTSFNEEEFVPSTNYKTLEKPEV